MSTTDPATLAETQAHDRAQEQSIRTALTQTTGLVEVAGVRRTYAAELAPVRALRGVTLSIQRGEFIAVMGPSGCGKSTLLNVIGGLEPVDEGTITVNDEVITGRREKWLATFRRRNIGIVFQFFNLLDGVSSLDNVALAGQLGGMTRAQAVAKSRDLLDLLGIGDRQAQLPTVLSGGQRQRLAIARALVNDPLLLLADEPTGALDSEGGQEILELFRRLHSGGQTIVMVTHSADVAKGAQRTVRMRDGNVVDPVSDAASAAELKSGK